MSVDIEAPGADEARLRAAVRALTRSVEVDIESSDILNLVATQKVLIPAPGAGKYIHVRDFTIEFSEGATPYAGDVNTDILTIYDTFTFVGDSIPQNRWVTWHGPMFAQGFDTVSPGYAGQELEYAQGHRDMSLVENKPLCLATLSHTEMTDGDGTAKAVFYYEIRDVLTA